MTLMLTQAAVGSSSFVNTRQVCKSFFKKVIFTHKEREALKEVDEGLTTGGGGRQESSLLCRKRT